MSDTRDQNSADAAELLIKAAMTAGIGGFCAATATPAQYAPAATPDMGRDVHRAVAVGLIEALRSLPVRLPSYTVAGLPSAASHTGAIVYCSNGAAGSPCVAFSNGTNWLRTDNNSAVSAT
jgi:hypothetical protein